MIGYDAMGLGNHDLDDGVAGIVPFIDDANFPILASNIVRMPTMFIILCSSLSSSYLSLSLSLTHTHTQTHKHKNTHTPPHTHARARSHNIPLPLSCSHTHIFVKDIFKMTKKHFKSFLVNNLLLSLLFSFQNATMEPGK